MRRRRKSDEEWQRLFAEFDQSGLTVAEFCQLHDVAKSSFHKRRSASRAQARKAFVAAKLSTRSDAAVTVLINDISIRCNAQTPVTWLADLLTALRG